MVDNPLSVSLKDVRVKRRGRTILGPVNLTLAGSGFTILIGPNGAGKTTLLKVLHGIERISAGTVQWSVADAEARQAQAYVFQRPIMLRRTVRQNLAYPLKLLGVPKSEIAQKVTDWAGRVGLHEMLDHPAPRLSGGEKQKLALGRALVRTPKVLFLDEPCANLDGRSTREIETVLRHANTTGTRIVMTTHDLGQARRLASDVLFLLHGKLHDQGSAPQIFSNPGTAEFQAFLQGDIVD
ncbi:energy-coupling factor ABC transporter ATP-binding protein [Roseovarius pelagicus]|uniref:Energy-coupling factor ABC transporter ATP-binding protein n=1 Tax=Roseovarius pelagicus TaxID=2980108 RepID=A0ABY6DFJ7_9RHOB|nr:ABC transporter ATP-binding protein [Roseovarius pelagicus]UXX84952.1 energy-coupling factor ABC transporter ATP-binding protein [Roseovarius pelagicus]